jgi:predicted CXXCH cytochrome family protein
MKRSILAMIILLVLVLTTAGSALASGGPHEDYFLEDNNCAACHRANTTIGTTSLIAADVTTLCLSCHGAGLGANTNVADGIYLSTRDDAAANKNIGAANTPDGAPLLGGGFNSYNGLPVTSAHGPTAGPLAHGNDGVRGQLATLIDGSVTCISCHDPHNSDNYRLLRETINGHPVSVAQVDEGAQKDYDSEQWGAGTSSLCAACHGAYHVSTASSGSDVTLLAPGGYTHRVDMPYNYGNNVNPETEGFAGYHLPLAQSGTGDQVVCMTCHLPHGTSVQMAPGNDSNLLRLDNHAACQVCHQK